ncbi:glycosyltransferase family 2 protein [Pseudomonas paeninsulae]|uniref:glycosyltransferase family 2 protein n=1 Tax=Pseudomonas paeninsulae TaxID=3110772 RepID=UPI002D764EAB|nr:glycosyltransferase family 2 protein [Pseudomonas sp. IT1137]
MCTYNGASFLAEQLESFQRQTHRNWTLYVSDDGSQDQTLHLLQVSSIQWGGGGRLQIVEGPRRGFVANFLSLTCRTHIKADFYAWSDQDDIWKEDKLQKALVWLKTIPGHIPALYCSRTELMCESGMLLGYSPKFSLAPHFSNALVQNIGGGNTMVFNQAARELLQEAGDNLAVPSHDWWAYQLISGAGGKVHYDPVPTVLYRQHDENLVGNNSCWIARFKRLRMVFQGHFYEWNTQNIHALETMRHRLSQEHQAKLTQFKAARRQKFILRILGFQRAGLYRQTLFGNLGLILATLLKKI